MKTRGIGALDVTVVGLGCNNFGTRIDAAATARVVRAALDAGVRFFDTADIYGGGRSEELLGRALGTRRNEALIATKFGKPMPDGKRGAAPAYVRSAVEASLRRLGTEVIDLYQLHEPDPSVPIEETLGALQELVAAGKVREIGFSNVSAAQIRQAEDASLRRGTARFASVQNEYSLLDRSAEADVLPECARRGIAFLPYYPLASGLLTGKYRRGSRAPEGSRLSGGRYADELSDENLRTVEALRAFAESRGHTLLELAFGWLLAQPAVASVIAGATRPEQVQANVAAAGWVLGAEELAAVDEIVPP
ncbi:MAG TPA: aldo/keto reductase [Gemmatimonadales bacterium]|nr:aldo/keto reductase [Gemmatimonadales bacterium]